MDVHALKLIKIKNSENIILGSLDSWMFIVASALSGFQRFLLKLKNDLFIYQ